MWKMRKVIGIAGSLAFLIGCMERNPVKPDGKDDSADSNRKSEKRPAYSLSVAPSDNIYWHYVDQGWDVAAAIRNYYYIRDSDRSVWMSADGFNNWQNLNFPGRANRIAASTGDTFSPSGPDYVAVVGEDGFIYLGGEGGGGWMKMTNRGNFKDVVFNYQEVWALGTDNLIYKTGEKNWLPAASATWTRWSDTPANALTIIYDRPLIVNKHFELFWWNNNRWEYKHANGVQDLCGTHWAGHFNDWSNIWINSGTGKLNYFYGYDPYDINRIWYEWRATGVSRVGCSLRTKLIVVNFDRTTYVKKPDAPL